MGPKEALLAGFVERLLGQPSPGTQEAEDGETEGRLGDGGMDLD